MRKVARLVRCFNCGFNLRRMLKGNIIDCIKDGLKFVNKGLKE